MSMAMKSAYQTEKDTNGRVSSKDASRASLRLAQKIVRQTPPKKK